VRWSEFEAAEPEIAQAGRRLLIGDDGVAIAFLATASASGRAHIAPVCPIFCESDVYLSAKTTSPKTRDLRANPSFALHACLAENDEEFQASGRANEVTDAGERARVHQAIRFGCYDAEHPVFRFEFERALWVWWENVGQPGTRPIRRTWVG